MDKRGFTNEEIRNDFIRATVLGCFLILIMVVLDGQGWLGKGIEQVLLKIIPPVVLMSIYWLHYVQKRQGSQYEYEFADSFYYMGFIFTLFALLLSFTWGALKGEGGDQNSIIGNLGVALATTIYGLSVRVGYVSFETSAEITQDQLNKDLQRSSTLLSLHVERVVNELEILTTKRLEPLKDTTKLLTASLADLNPNISEIKDSVAGAHQAMRSLAESSNDTRDGFLGLNSSSTDLAHSIVGASEAADSAGEGFIVLGQKVTDISESLVSSTSAQLESIRAIGASLDSVVVQVAAVATTVGSTDINLKAAFTALQSAIQSNNLAWGSQTTALQQFVRAADPAKLAFGEISKSLVDMEGSLSSIGSLASTISDIQTDIKKVSDTDFYAAHKNALDKIVSASASFEKSFKNIEILNKTITDYGGKSAAMLSEVETRLIQNLRDLNTQIKNQ